MNWVLVFLRGYLTVKVTGKSVVRLLNLCNNIGISIWNIQYCKDGIKMCIYAKDFYDICQLIRKTKCKIHIAQKTGVPFLNKWIRRKITMCIGGFLFIIGLLLTQNYIWNIEIEGNWQISNEQFQDELISMGIREGICKKNVDLGEAEEHFRDTFQQLTWICVKYVGNTLQISVKENQLAKMNGGENVTISHMLENEGELTEDLSKNDLVALQSGKIVKQIVRRGTAVLHIGDDVEKGQVLVKGTIDLKREDGTVEEVPVGKADADIWLEYVLPIQESYNIVEVEKHYTGRQKEYLGIGWNNKIITMFDLLETRAATYANEEIWEIGNKKEGNRWEKSRPFLWRYKVIEYEYLENKRTSEQGKAYFQQKLMEFIETLEGKGVQIIEKDVKMENDGVCYTMTGKLRCIGPMQDLATGEN